MTIKELLGDKNFSSGQLRNFGLFLYWAIENKLIQVHKYTEYRCGELRPMWLKPFVDAQHPIDHEDVVKAAQGYIAVLREMNLSPIGTGSPNAEYNAKPLLTSKKEKELEVFSWNLTGVVKAYGDKHLKKQGGRKKKVKKHFMQYLKAQKELNVIFLDTTF